MKSWSCLSLGDGLIASMPSAEIEEEFLREKPAPAGLGLLAGRSPGLRYSRAGFPVGMEQM